MGKKILLVANVAKEHVLKFHVPTIKKFKDEGWTVDVACSGEEKIPFCDHQYNMCWHRSPFTYKTFKGISDLKKILAENQYDIVYCHTPVGGFAARLAARKFRKKGTKVVYFTHGFHFYKGAPLLNWLIYYPVEKFLSYFTDEIIAVNKEDFNNAKKRFKSVKKVYFSHSTGVNLTKFDIDDRAAVRAEYRKKLNLGNSLTLVYVAELNKNKNQIMLLKMMAELVKTVPDAVLLLVGPDHQQGFHQQRAEALGIGKNVKILGWRSDVPQILAASDICVPSSVREGFGINLVESMKSGLPVVATANRGHKTIIKNGFNGFTVEIGDYKAMAQTVEKIANDKVLRDTITSNALKDISKYDTQTVANKLYKIII